MKFEKIQGNNSAKFGKIQGNKTKFALVADNRREKQL